jgi:trehalose-6-phosphate synthase
VHKYRELLREVNVLVSSINGRFGTPDWVPVLYFYRSFPFEKLTPLYAIADVLLVTPLRDGMNLIAKEYIATRSDRKGVLILSETAGAAQELGESLIVNPNNTEEIAAAMKTALELRPSEQRRRNVAGAFKVDRARAARVKGKKIIVIDDVITTGATVEACARGLKRAGAARVDVLALARVVEPTAFVL